MTKQNRRDDKPVVVNAFILLIFLGLVLPPILINIGGNAREHDQRDTFQTVNAFLHNPLTLQEQYALHANTATTPGHHLTLGWVANVFANGKVGSDVLVVRFVNMLFGLALIVTVWQLLFFASSGDSLKAFCLTLPLLTSYYFLSAAIWAKEENAALLWVCLALFIIMRQKSSLGSTLLASLCAVLTVLWRHIHIWILAPVLLKTMQNAKPDKRWATAMLVIFPSTGVLFYFLSIWGSLTPVSSTAQNLHHAHLNPGALIYICSLFGIYSLFFIGYIWKHVPKIIGENYKANLMILTLCGLMLAGVCHTVYNKEAGRWGGIIWEMTRMFPNIKGRSIIFFFLLPMGFVSIYVWLKSAFTREKIFIPAAFISWCAAHLVNPMSWHRYYEPMILIFLAIFAANVKEHSSFAYMGPLVLSALLLFTSVSKIYGFI